MEEALRGALDYDYRKYDQIWQRVSPTLTPYPPDAGGTEIAPQTPQTPQTAQMQTAQTQTAQAQMQTPQTAQTTAGNAQDPEPGCCLGAEAARLLETLTGFLEGELSDRRYYLAFARQAPAWMRQTLRDIAADEGEHARLLSAVYYLITGNCYDASADGERLYIGRTCPALRLRYHEETCGAQAYLRAAAATADPCLAKILTELSADEYRHAGELTELLERAISGTCGAARTGV